MGAYLDKPITKKDTAQASGNGFRAYVSSMQGWRSSMEDACLVECSLAGNEKVGFFGVFDGHGGVHASSYCMDHLLDCLTSQTDYKGEETTPEDYVLVYKKGYIQFDELVYQDQISHRVDHCGTTAITAFVTPTHIICANLGDSRCVLNNDGTAVPLSFDHKPSNDTEYNRISKAGGTVITGRVRGDLAVSRAFGDFSYKQVQGVPATEQWVIAEPDVKIIERNASQRYLLFACDGIWDAIPDIQKCITILDELLASCENPCDALSDLLELCLDWNSTDNMTVVLVLFEGAPKPDPEKVKARNNRKKEQEEIKMKLNEDSKKQMNKEDADTPIDPSDEFMNDPHGNNTESEKKEECSKENDYYVYCKGCGEYFEQNQLISHNQSCSASPEIIKRFVNRYESVLYKDVPDKYKQSNEEKQQEN
ncbi:hypothetical protein WA158_004360 [Blastocystis sp. Blastoise]